MNYIAAREREALLDFAFTGGRLQMQTLLDTDVYRHLRFAAPDTTYGSFEIITAPYTLVYIAADHEHRLVFRAAYDGLSTFRGPSSPRTNDRAHWVPAEYWTQRLPRRGLEVRSYDRRVAEILIEEIITDWAEDWQPGELGPSPESLQEQLDLSRHDLAYEEGARQLLSEWESEGVCSDVWEMDFTSLDRWYLVALHQIVAGTHTYFGDEVDYSAWDLRRGIASRVGAARRYRQNQALREHTPRSTLGTRIATLDVL